MEWREETDQREGMGAAVWLVLACLVALLAALGFVIAASL